MNEIELRKEYSEYDPNQDYNGNKGIAIAETLFKRCGYNFKNLNKWIMMQNLSQLTQESYEIERLN